MTTDSTQSSLETAPDRDSRTAPCIRRGQTIGAAAMVRGGA